MLFGGKRCQTCWWKSKRLSEWQNEVPVRKCQNESCGKDMARHVKIGNGVGRYLSKAEYEKKRFCCRSCANAVLTRERIKNGYITPFMRENAGKRPPLEELNKLWSKTRSYKEMALTLGVSYGSIQSWMGPQKILKNPNILYRNTHDVETLKPVHNRVSGMWSGIKGKFADKKYNRY